MDKSVHLFQSFYISVAFYGLLIREHFRRMIKLKRQFQVTCCVLPGNILFQKCNKFIHLYHGLTKIVKSFLHWNRCDLNRAMFLKTLKIDWEVFCFLLLCFLFFWGGGVYMSWSRVGRGVEKCFAFSATWVVNFWSYLNRSSFDRFDRFIRIRLLLTV